MDIHQVFDQAQSDAQLTDLECELLVTNSVDTMLYPDLRKDWATDQPIFPALYAACDKNVEHEYDNTDFTSNYTYTPTSSNLAGSAFSEESSPCQNPQLTSPEVSPDYLDGRQRSPSTQSNNRRERKPISTNRDPTKSYQRKPSKQVQTKGATGDVCGDAKRSRTASTTTKKNLSTLPDINSEQNRKQQKMNRCASSKYRIRQREARRDLETVEKDMAQSNHDLSICVKDLRNEVYNLKMKVLQHTNCDCPLIQEYITNHANQYIQELEGRRQCQQLEQYYGK